METERVTASTTIEATPEAVFAVLADPASHAAIDGTGWVNESLDGERITAVGQVFRMSMYHPNHPDKNYEIANLVELFDAPRTIAWKPGTESAETGEHSFGGWTWRYDLEANEEFVGQALDHLEIKLELVQVYEEIEGRDYDRAVLQVAIARSLRARKDVESLQGAHGLLREVTCVYPELVADDLLQLEKLLELNDEKPATPDSGRAAVQRFAAGLGRPPRVLVVGGNERQRRHHGRLEQLGREWGFDSEWLMTNYTSPQKTVNAIADRMKGGVELLVLLHWNRHETTEPALELARKSNVVARTIHYAGFTSLQVGLSELLATLATTPEPKTGKGSGRRAAMR
jgi:hypothetical protein